MTTSRDRRGHPRLAPIGAGVQASARLRPGLTVTLVNWSASGTLIETTSRLVPGLPVNLMVSAGASHANLRGIVVHCRVWALTDRICYRAGIRWPLGRLYTPGAEVASDEKTLPSDTFEDPAPTPLRHAWSRAGLLGTELGRSSQR